MKATLSKAPWRLVRNRDGSINIVSAVDEEDCSNKVALINNRNLANATLICAAPDLLEALVELSLKVVIPCTDAGNALHKKVQDAIAKATLAAPEQAK